jgi:hypothetical protein
MKIKKSIFMKVFMKSLRMLLLLLVTATSLCAASETTITEDLIKSTAETLHDMAENCDKIPEDVLKNALQNLPKLDHLTLKQHQQIFEYKKNGKNVVESIRFKNCDACKRYATILKGAEMQTDIAVDVLGLGDTSLEDARKNKQYEMLGYYVRSETMRYFW